jgi:hypothetical protein
VPEFDLTEGVYTQAAPTVGDYVKAIHLLRYLYSTATLGRVFDATAVDIIIHADAAFANNANGASTGAFFLSVGPANAPFHSEAKAQIDVATCPMTAEYYTAGAACKAIVHYRQLADDLGWSLIRPSTMILDAKTAINLVTAPEVTRKARHMFVEHHYIRDVAAKGIIALTYVPSEQQRADVMTKHLSPSAFVKGQAALLNLSSLPS